MNRKMSFVLAAVMVLAVSAVFVGDANVSVACDKTAKTASVEGVKACTSEAVALIGADAKDCCKAAVTAMVKTWHKGSAVTTSTKSSCTKSAAAKTAGASGCQKSVSVVTASANECCREAMELVKAECCPEGVTTTTSASECNKSAALTLAGLKATCDKSASAKTASADCCAEKASAKTAGAYSCDKSAKASVAGSKSSCLSESKVTTASIDRNIPYRDGKRVVLTGAPVCGKCNLKITESCESLFQTADGKIYPVLKNSRYKKIRGEKSDNGFKVVTRVRNLDGVKYLQIESYEKI